MWLSPIHAFVISFFLFPLLSQNDSTYDATYAYSASSSSPICFKNRIIRHPKVGASIIP